MPKVKIPRKAVIPVAGYATRFLPQTKAMPKQMLPLVDKPIIQYIVEDLVSAGIKDIIFVTSPQARSIEDHFDKPTLDLVENLKRGGSKKLKYLEEVEKIASLANFVYIRQTGRYGNATPLVNASHLINNEPFIYTWGDDLFEGSGNEYTQLIEKYKKYNSHCLSCDTTTDKSDFSRYGFISGKEIENGVLNVQKMLEKPGEDVAKKEKLSYFQASSMLFTPEIFDYIDSTISKLKENQEFFVSDIIAEMLKENQKVMGVKITGSKYMDTGNKLDYLKAVVEFASKNESIGEDFKRWLKTKTTNL